MITSKKVPKGVSFFLSPTVIPKNILFDDSTIYKNDKDFLTNTIFQYNKKLFFNNLLLKSIKNIYT